MKHLIALGGNITTEKSDSAQFLTAGLAQFEACELTICNLSRFYRTPAFPEGSGPDFVNAAALVEGPESPQQLLKALHAIENRLGRVRTQRWGSRTLDLDLLASGQMVCPDAQTHKMWRDLSVAQQQSRTPSELILPHPRLQDRAFVLVPLSDVAPDWRHPLLGKTVQEMLQDLPKADCDTVRPL